VVQALADLSSDDSTAEAADAALRSLIDGWLAQDLITESAERAYDANQVAERVARLAALPANDIRSKVVVAGFTREPWGVAGDDLEQSCATCMYYETHRRFCALPELRLPVAPQWSCTLWRI
jgi:hypothetical protein